MRLPGRPSMRVGNLESKKKNLFCRGELCSPARSHRDAAIGGPPVVRTTQPKTITRGNDFRPKAKLAAPEAMREHCRGFGGASSPKKRGVTGPAIEAPQRG